METSIHFQEKIGAINKSKCNCLIPVTLIFYSIEEVRFRILITSLRLFLFEILSEAISIISSAGIRTYSLGTLEFEKFSLSDSKAFPKASAILLTSLESCDASFKLYY